MIYRLQYQYSMLIFNGYCREKGALVIFVFYRLETYQLTNFFTEFENLLFEILH